MRLSDGTALHCRCILCRTLITLTKQPRGKRDVESQCYLSSGTPPDEHAGTVGSQSSDAASALPVWLLRRAALSVCAMGSPAPRVKPRAEVCRLASSKPCMG